MINVAHLEFNIVTHCTNRCIACSHGSPFTPPWFMDPAQIENDLRLIRPICHAEYVCLLGGEPLLHPDIVRIMEIVKASGVGNYHQVLTNGQLLPQMPDEFWRAAQSIQISRYDNLPQAVVDLAYVKQQQFGVKHLGVTKHDAFCKQFLKVPDPTGASFIPCRWKNECYTLHQGRFFLCPQSTFWPQLFMNLPPETDGIALEGLTEEKLLAFMRRKEPLQSCTICQAYSQGVAWGQANTREEWIRLSTIT